MRCSGRIGRILLGGALGLAGGVCAADLAWTFEIEDHPAVVRDVSASAAFAEPFETVAPSFGVATLADDFETVFGNSVWVDGLNLDSRPCSTLVLVR